MEDESNELIDLGQHSCRVAAEDDSEGSIGVFLTLPELLPEPLLAGRTVVGSTVARLTGTHAGDAGSLVIVLHQCEARFAARTDLSALASRAVGIAGLADTIEVSVVAIGTNHALIRIGTVALKTVFNNRAL